jgi:hypothetical protein
MRSLARNIASARMRGHRPFMRRFVPFLALSLAGCMARQPEAQPEVVQPAPQPEARPRQLVGLTPQEVVGHLGHPTLQVREGTSLKLQFSNRRCVLDAYFYPSTNGAMRVTWIDTRTANGADTDQAACISDLETPS